jgi:hypothetical protein
MMLENDSRTIKIYWERSSQMASRTMSSLPASVVGKQVPMRITIGKTGILQIGICKGDQAKR